MTSYHAAVAVSFLLVTLVGCTPQGTPEITPQLAAKGQGSWACEFAANMEAAVDELHVAVRSIQRGDPAGGRQVAARVYAGIRSDMQSLGEGAIAPTQHETLFAAPFVLLAPAVLDVAVAIDPALESRPHSGEPAALLAELDRSLAAAKSQARSDDPGGVACRGAAVSPIWSTGSRRSMVKTLRIARLGAAPRTSWTQYSRWSDRLA